MGWGSGVNDQPADPVNQQNVLFNQVKRKFKAKQLNVKRQVKNYEEHPEEGICYAIIEKPKTKQFVSYSRLLTQIDNLDLQHQAQQNNLEML